VTTTVAPSARNDRLLGLPLGDVMRLERSGIAFTGHLSLNGWEMLGRRLLGLGDSVSWWVADWLVYGEDQFKDRYEEAVRRTALTYQTLRNYVWVARRFELSRRRDNLSFGHHAEVAALGNAEQDYWLRKAQESGWSRNRLRTEVRSSVRARPTTAGEAPEDRVAVDGPPPADREDGHGSTEARAHEELSVRLTSQQLAHCQAAADAQNLTLDNWATTALVRAAVSEHSCECGDARSST